MICLATQNQTRDFDTQNADCKTFLTTILKNYRNFRRCFYNYMRRVCRSVLQKRTSKLLLQKYRQTCTHNPHRAARTCFLPPQWAYTQTAAKSYQVHRDVFIRESSTEKMSELGHKARQGSDRSTSWWGSVVRINESYWISSCTTTHGLNQLERTAKLKPNSHDTPGQICKQNAAAQRVACAKGGAS